MASTCPRHVGGGDPRTEKPTCLQLRELLQRFGPNQSGGRERFCRTFYTGFQIGCSKGFSISAGRLADPTRIAPRWIAYTAADSRHGVRCLESRRIRSADNCPAGAGGDRAKSHVSRPHDNTDAPYQSRRAEGSDAPSGYRSEGPRKQRPALTIRGSRISDPLNRPCLRQVRRAMAGVRAKSVFPGPGLSP